MIPKWTQGDPTGTQRRPWGPEATQMGPRATQRGPNVEKTCFLIHFWNQHGSQNRSNFFFYDLLNIFWKRFCGFCGSLLVPFWCRVRYVAIEKQEKCVDIAKVIKKGIEETMKNQSRFWEHFWYILAPKMGETCTRKVIKIRLEKR